MALLCFFALAAKAQNSTESRHYETVEYNNNHVRQGRHYSVDNKLLRRQARRQGSESHWEEITVPLVFHVVHTELDAPLNLQSIHEQVASLNADFAGATMPEQEDSRDVKGDFGQKIADTRIKFCYATTKKDENALINFIVASERDYFNLDSLRSKNGMAPALDPKKYVNIWIVPERFIRTGFALFPGGSNQLDGIVISEAYFGTGPHTFAKFNRGKTLTHLMGNYLGLLPIWGDGRCGDDGISDTPVHNAPNFGKPRPFHYSTCSNSTLEMTMNFMDNTDDDQVYMFTWEQAQWMRAVLSRKGPREKLSLTPVTCELQGLDNHQLTVFNKGSLQSNSSEVTSGELLSVIPNPATDLLSIQFGEVTGMDTYILQVFGMRGELQYRQTNVSPQSTVWLSVAEWARGTYVVSVVAVKSGARLSRRVVLQ